MQNADDMVFDQRVENVTSDIYDNLRLCTGSRVGVHKTRKWVKRGFQAQLTVTFSWEGEDNWC